MTEDRDEVRVHLIEQWMSKGDYDLSVAALIMESMPDATEAIGFHLQQAAEKYLKAFLTLMDQQPPHTHDLQALRSLVALIDADLAEQVQPLGALNPFAVIYRYPGDAPNVDRDHLEELRTETARLRDTVVTRIAAAGEKTDGESTVDEGGAP